LSSQSFKWFDVSWQFEMRGWKLQWKIYFLSFKLNNFWIFLKEKKKIQSIILESNETNMELIQRYKDEGAHIYDMPGESPINIIWISRVIFSLLDSEGIGHNFLICNFDFFFYLIGVWLIDWIFGRLDIFRILWNLQLLWGFFGWNIDLKSWDKQFWCTFDRRLGKNWWSSSSNPDQN
jgi:hypothetical protein